MCLVSVVRPLPDVARARAQHAEIDAANSHSDVVPARRVTVEPRDTRSSLDAAAVTPPAIPPPVRYAIVELHTLAGRNVIPVVFARSARGPPVG
jgi:hypothetical protein